MNPKLKNAISLYMEGIRDGHPREAIQKYSGERYTQHSTGVKDGRAGFIEFFEDFIIRNPKRDIRIIRGLVDGQYVFVHAFQSLNGGEAQWVTTDFFDTDENDKLIEHWDVIAEYEARTPSGHSTIDGPTEISDLDKTEENKRLVENLIKDVLMKGGNPKNLVKYISKTAYIQHSKSLEDGFEPYMRIVSAPERPFNYEELVLLVGQGNFVATLCKVNRKNGKGYQEYAQVDLFRIEDGKIVEHWENAEVVPEVSVNSGKF
jgi:predicted SnoaL-like aldol condensation-catalyzing enzyme